VEAILDSRHRRGRLEYLVKWKDFGREENSWEPAKEVFAGDLILDFHRKHPGAPRQIRNMDFGSIPFRTVPVVTAPSRRNFRGGVDVRGTLLPHPLPSIPDPVDLFPPHQPLVKLPTRP